MNEKTNKILTNILGILLLVAFFLLPYYGGISEGPTISMWKILTTDSELNSGSLWLYLLLLCPVYLILDVNKEKLSLPKFAFPLPLGLTAALPLVSFVIYSFYISDNSWINASWGYYVYLIGAVFIVTTNVPSAKTKKSFEIQKAVAIAGGTVMLFFIMKNVYLLSYNGNHLTAFSNLSQWWDYTGAIEFLKVVAWIILIAATLTFVVAFKETKTLESIRQSLPSPKKQTVILIALSAFALLMVFVLTLIKDVNIRIDPAAPTCLILSIGLLDIAGNEYGTVDDKKITEKSEAEQQEKTDDEEIGGLV